MTLKTYRSDISPKRSFKVL